MTNYSLPRAHRWRRYCLALPILLLVFGGLVTPVYANAPPAEPSGVQTPPPVASTTSASTTSVSAAPASTAPANTVQASPTPAAGYYQASGANQTPGTGGHLFSVTLALLFIVFLIVAVSWFVRRFGQGVFATNTHIKIIATLPLGTRERLLLVDIAGQQLLLGVTAQQINNLHVFSEPVVDTAHPPAPSEFSQKLMALLQAKMPAQQPIAQRKNNPSASE